MPSDNLGVGVFHRALASSSTSLSGQPGRSAQPGSSDPAIASAARSRGLDWFLVSALLMVGDAAVVAVSVYLAALLGAVPDGALDVTLLGMPPLVVLAFLERGLYGRANLNRRAFPLYKIAAGWVHGMGVFLLLRVIVAPAVLFILSLPGSPAQGVLNPMLLAGFAVGLAALVAWRFAWRLVGPRVARPAGDRVVIVGDYVESARLLSRLRDQAGVEVVGVIEPSGSRSARTIEGLQVMAGLEELTAMVRGGLVDTALVAPGRHDDGDALRLVLEQARVSTLDVKVLPQLGGGATAPVGVGHGTISRIGDLPVIELQRRPLGPRALLLKRAEDLVVGSLMLVLLLPILVLVALAIRMDTKGPIFFRQPRVGLNGNVFEMFKFRSMHHHAVDPGAVRQTARGDKRVTRVGAVLRRHSLDELPQILNVLRGDMSIVGPRPHALAMTAQGMALEEAAKDYPARFRMKPGITGWAQTNGWRGNVDTVEKLVRRVEHDLFYIDNWSLGLDLLILRKTVSCVFSDDTAY